MFDQVHFLWENALPDDFSNIKNALNSINWVAHSHTKYTNTGADELRDRISPMRSSSGKAIVMSGGVKLLELGFFLRRMDNFLTDLLTDPEKVNGLLNTLTDMHLDGLGEKCRSFGDLVDVIRFGDDLGMNKGQYAYCLTFPHKETSESV